MTRTLKWTLAVVILGSALVAGQLLAQGYPPKPGPSGPSPLTPGAVGVVQPPAEKEKPRIYNPIRPGDIGTISSAASMYMSYVKLPDVFYEEVRAFPDDAVRAGITPRAYFAFRTRPDGSNLICFVKLDNPDVQVLKEAQPVRGTEIYLMGRVGQRILVGDGGATAFEADRVVLGHEEPKAPKVEKKKPVGLVVERIGPGGRLMKQEFSIPTPGDRYRIPDPSDPENRAKDIYVTLKF